jgi:hypothetical protein
MDLTFMAVCTLLVIALRLDLIRLNHEAFTKYGNKSIELNPINSRLFKKFGALPIMIVETLSLIPFFYIIHLLGYYYEVIIFFSGITVMNYFNDYWTLKIIKKREQQQLF